jgi:hypothetical protein
MDDNVGGRDARHFVANLPIETLRPFGGVDVICNGNCHDFVVTIIRISFSFHYTIHISRFCLADRCRT